jgi:hypothetical protein
MKRFFSLMGVAFSATLFAQVNEAQILQKVNENITHADGNYYIEHQHTDSRGFTHVYLRQTYNGKDIFNAYAAVHLNKTGELVHKTGQFFNVNISPAKAKLAFNSAVEMAAASKNLSLPTSSFKTQQIINGKIAIESSNTSSEKILAKEGYLFENGILRPVWQVELYEDATNDWWCMYLDANSGEKIAEHSYTTHCNLNHIVSSNPDAIGYNFTFSEEPKGFTLEKNANSPKYRAWSLPYETPAKGQRKLLNHEFDSEASPFGWHDTNGVAGPDLFVTRGNNVFAMEDTLARNSLNNYSPKADSNFVFDFPYDVDARPRENLNAAITNLFVWNNYIHDIMYHYGFTEESGNFQYKNYSGKGKDNDYVIADAQDGSGTNNANFSAPVDGQRGRMQMYLWPPNNMPTTNLSVTYPQSLAREYNSPLSVFGGRLGTIPITGKIVLYRDSNATTSLACVLPANAAELAGNIALIDRGTCAFTNKVLAAQQAGAIAAIVVNNATNAMAMTGTNSAITIPSVMITSIDGAAIKNALLNDSVVGSLTDATRNIRIYDSDFDNGVITHEYGHGVSIRLTGGAANSSCLNNQEQAGEGWSDFLALVLTTRKWENKQTSRGIGNFLINQDTNGLGIRPFRYSYNMSVNPVTYNNTRTLSVPHGVGFVWASILYDIMWDLIDVYGFDEDVYKGKGGNNIALQLVIDGLKLQKCQPGFVDSRDAILLADSLYNGNKHRELLWKAFARRGLGYSANQGLSTSRTDNIEAFDLPPDLAANSVNRIALGNNQINLYPNPFETGFTVSLSNNSVIKSISIMQLDGKSIQTFNPTDRSNNFYLNTENLPVGFYLIKVVTQNNELYYIKSVKQ